MFFKKNNYSQKISQKTAKFYQEMALEFSQSRSVWWDGFNFIKKYLKGKPEILDFGCGNGRLIDYLYQEKNQEFDYLGVDNSAKMIQLAQKRYPTHQFLTINSGSELEKLGKKFDLVFSIAVFHHFNKEMAKQTLADFMKVLKKEGLVIVSVWHLWQKKYLKNLLQSNLGGNWGFWADIPFKKGNKEAVRPCYFWTLRSLEKVFLQNGFEIIEKGYTSDKRGKKRNLFLVAKLVS